MPYINVGAFLKDENGDFTVRPRSKAAVRKVIAEDPASVYFDKTSAFNGQGGFAGDDLPEGVTLSLVGPDPYTLRNFYGSVLVKTVKGVKRTVVEQMATMLLNAAAKHAGVCRCCSEVFGKADRRKTTKAQRVRENVAWRKDQAQ